MTVQEVDGQINFDPSCWTLAIAMSWEVFVVRFGELLLGGILHQDPTKVASQSWRFGEATLPFFLHGEAEGFKHEGDGEAVGAFPHGLFGKRAGLAFIEPDGELVERSLPAEDRLDQSKEISGGRKFGGMTLNEFCFSCDLVETGEE